MDEPSTSTSAGSIYSNVTQRTQITQGGTRKKGDIAGFVLKLIRHGKLSAEKGRDGLDEAFVTSIQMIFEKLSDETRINKVFNQVRLMSDADHGNTLEEFSVAWFELLQLTTESEKLRLSGLVFILSTLEHLDISCHSFVGLYNAVILESARAQPSSIIAVFDYVQKKITNPGDKDVSKRWKDCLLVLVCKLRDTAKITVNGIPVNGKDLVMDTLYEWLGKATTPMIFTQVVEIIKDADLLHVTDKYLEERIFDNISDEAQRVLLTWKAISLMPTANPKLLDRICRALTFVWIVSLEPSADPSTISADLVKIIQLMANVMKDHAAVQKAYMHLFKNNRGMVMKSQFGILTMIAMCGIDRYKNNALTELKRTIQKLWRLDEEVRQNSWFADTQAADIVRIVDRQIADILLSISDETTWKLLCGPLIALAQSLLECPSSKEVMIVDGRIADGCPLWMLANTIMTKCFLARTDAIEAHLHSIIQSISSAANTSAALILIDVLVEIVKKCTVNVLNKWELLQTLFGYVCRMRRDVAVSLIRCLLPVINNRLQLREALYKGLKKDLLSEATVGSAVPILLLLLKSVAQKRDLTASQSQGRQMSQSFATFSSQTLAEMGMKKTSDEKLGMELVGILKRCLSQPAPTKIALYEGISEAAGRNLSLIGPCLDMLVTHAALVDKWTSETNVIATKTLSQLKEPMPQLAQAIESLLCEAISLTSHSSTDMAGLDDLITKAHELLDGWVSKAAMMDVHDLGVDKLSEWNPNTMSGRSNLVFSHMMMSLYDVLVEYIWRRLAVLHREADGDRLIAVMKRRREMKEVLEDKTVRRKEAKVGATECATVDLHQGEVLTSIRTLAELFQWLVPVDAPQEETLVEVRAEVLEWTIDRAHVLSASLNKTHHPLHSIISGSASLFSVASNLLLFYIGSDCAEWLREMDAADEMKTKALESYANIINYLSIKYHTKPEKIIQIWQKTEPNGTMIGTQAEVPSTNACLVRHAHLFMTKLYPGMIRLDTQEHEAKNKKICVELEKQTKAMIKISRSVLSMTTTSRAYSTAFSFIAKMLENNTFSNNVMLRELLKFVGEIRLKGCDDKNTMRRNILKMTDELLQVFSEDDDRQRYAFINMPSESAVSEFLMTVVEKTLTSVRTLITFAQEFFSKDDQLDALIGCVIAKCDECADMVSRLLPIHTQYKSHKEKIVQMLTSFFTSVEFPVKLMLDNSKAIAVLVEWKSIDLLSNLSNTKIQAIMAIADENVGTMEKEERKGSKKRLTAKSKRDETIYVKYVKARESLQSRVLLLCSALKKDERLDLQVKNNAIGQRDFRINMRMLNQRLAEKEKDDEGPPKKKKKQTQQRTQREESDESTTKEQENTRDADITEEVEGEGDPNNSIVY